MTYWWGEGTSAERAQFEEAMRQDSELAAFVRGLASTAEWLWESAGEQVPAPELRERILKIPYEMEQVPVPHMQIPLGKRRTTPFVLATLMGIFAAAAVLIAIDDGHRRDQANRLETQLTEQTHRSALRGLQIASMSAQNPAMAGAKVAVVWNADRQEGLVNLDGLPRAAPGKDYQLWVIDASSPKPVGAGTLSPSESGKLVKAFHPDRPVSSAQKFAISVEPTGGSPEPTGPIIFVGG